MPRLSPPEPATYTPEQKRVHEAITSGPRGRVQGPLAMWLHRPELADKAQALGAYCRFGTSLPPRLSELAILTTAVIWRAEFEWYAHKPIALEAGVAPEVVDALLAGREPAFAQEDEAVVHAFARTLHTERCIPDELYERAIRVLGQDAVVDLTGVLGYYTLISMTLNVFEVALPDGAAPVFADRK